MTRIAIFAVAAFAFSACDEITDTKDDTATTDDSGDDCTYDGPILITDATFTCDAAADLVTFTVNTSGVPSDGLWFSQETANAEPNFSDEHVLTVTEEDLDCGKDAALTATVETDKTDIGDVGPNDGTFFSCDDDQHYLAQVMSYAIRVFDADGVQADCIISGHDPSGLVNDDYDRINDPVDPEDLKGCEILNLSKTY